MSQITLETDILADGEVYKLKHTLEMGQHHLKLVSQNSIPIIDKEIDEEQYNELLQGIEKEKFIKMMAS